MAAKAKSAAKKTTSKAKSTTKNVSKAVTSKTAPAVKQTKTTVKSASSTRTSIVDKLALRVRNDRLTLGALIAEFIGVFILSAGVLAVSGNQLVVLFILIAATLVVLPLSGAHLNPAISLGLWVARRISAVRMVGYVIAQFLGAILAYVVMDAILNGFASTDGLTAARELYALTPAPTGKEGVAFGAEVVGALVFGFAFASAIYSARDQISRAFIVGGGFFAGLLITGQTAVLNPALALSVGAFFTPAAAEVGKYFLVWELVIYVLGAAIGATLGVLLYKLLQRNVPETTA